MSLTSMPSGCLSVNINGIRDDNRPENLELWSKGQPAGQRVADKVAWAVDLLERYGYSVTPPHD